MEHIIEIYIILLSLFYFACDLFESCTGNMLYKISLLF